MVYGAKRRYPRIRNTGSVTYECTKNDFESLNYYNSLLQWILSESHIPPEKQIHVLLFPALRVRAIGCWYWMRWAETNCK